MTSHITNKEEESSNRDQNGNACQVDLDGYWCFNVEVDSKINPNNHSTDNLLSCIGPLIKKFQESLVKEANCMDKLQDLCCILQKENYFLRHQIDGLKEFTIALKMDQLASYKRELSMLQNRIYILETALRVELLKSSEYKKEINDIRYILSQKTRRKVKKGQAFEVVIAQKPQEVTLASCAKPLHENVESCPICLEQFDVVSGWYTLNCGHRYHLLCLAKVMPTRARCCVCNKDLHKILYEIFGLANCYPDDGRLWDAQTGHPVDFTIEEDIRAILEELQDIEESLGEEETPETNDVHRDNATENVSGSENEGGHSEVEYNNDQGNDLENEVDTESYVESYHASSSDEEEQDDPNDPNYEPSNDIHGRRNLM